MDVTIDSELDHLGVWMKHVTRHMDRDLVKKTARTFALEFVKRAIMRTPVDTGRARGGWTALMRMEGVPVPPDTRNSKNFSEEKFRKGEGESSARITDKYVEVINNVPYIMRLEYGHSQSQAPAGMVRISLRELRSDRDLPKNLLKMFEELLEKSNRTARLAQ